MNTMGSHEYRGPHQLHDRVEELERQNKLMREALKRINNSAFGFNKDGWCGSVAQEALTAVEQINQNKE